MLDSCNVVDLYSMDDRDIDDLYLSVSHFNIRYNKTKKYEIIVDQLLQYGSVKEVWCIVTNTARALKQQAVGLSIPKQKEPYCNNPQGLSYAKMFKLLDNMVEASLLTFYRGGLRNMRKDDRLQSVYMFNDKWLALWSEIDISGERFDVQSIQVKARTTKQLLSNKGRKGIASKEKSVVLLNEMLENTQIYVDNISVCVQQYTRIFNDDLTKGGRFYNVVGGVQTLPQKRRKDMQINGEKVIELDFKAIHPSLLYEKAWQKAPEVVEYWIKEKRGGEYVPYPNFSPYFSPDNPEDSHTVRGLHKFAVMVGLNAKNIASATRSLSEEFFEDKKRNSPKYGDVSYILGINGKPTFPSKRICEHVQMWNKPISEFFFSDVGIVLQNIDSDIMAVVIEELYEMGEVLLPVHDSIMVRESIAEAAEKLMRKAYKDIMGTDKFCLIERK